MGGKQKVLQPSLLWLRLKMLSNPKEIGLLFKRGRKHKVLQPSYLWLRLEILTKPKEIGLLSYGKKLNTPSRRIWQVKAEIFLIIQK